MKRKYSFIYETVLGVLRETYLQATAVYCVTLTLTLVACCRKTVSSTDRCFTQR